MLVRDHHGIFLAAMSCWQCCSILEPALAKVISCREALSWIKELGFHSVVVESNSLVVFGAINHSWIDSFMFGMIIAYCLSIVKEISLL